MEHRYREVMRAACLLFQRGEFVYSPIQTWHEGAKRYDLPRHFEPWWKLDEQFIRACRRLRVLTLDGWRTSVGVTREITFAHALGKPVLYLDPDDYSLVRDVGLDEMVRGKGTR